MATNDLNISDLTFEGIRSSLIDYLKRQSTFTDYNFEGSGIKTIVDLLAYNTFYYGYYANMMANEMFLDSAKLTNSIISLTKPLGYLVYGSISARSTIKLTNVNNVENLSAFSVFRGLDISGRPYYFYNIDPIELRTISDNFYGTDYFDIYEARSIVRRELISVDLEDQSFSLNDINIDPRTIKVEVRYAGETEFITWKNFLINSDLIVTSDTEVFFVERTKKGYNVNFGKYTFSDTGSVGKQVGNLDEVYVSYLISSGSAGNNISNFVFVADSGGLSISKAGTQLEIYTSSFGGSSEPSLDEIRFFAPKTFARQNRLVTRNDYFAIMNELGYGSNGNPDQKFKIFGGEEATPPVYGRVFVSLLNLNASTEENEINQVLSVLKDKSVVSILPEYVAPIEIKTFITASFGIEDQSVQQFAKSVIRSNLGLAYSTKKFNTNINKLEIVNIIKNSYAGIDVTEQDIKFNFETTLKQTTDTVGSVGKRISLKNRLNSVSIRGIQFGYTAKSTKGGSKYLYLYSNSDGSKLPNPIGEVYFNEGIIIIYPEVSSNELTVSFEINGSILFAKEQLVCFVNDVEKDITLSMREID